MKNLQLTICFMVVCYFNSPLFSQSQPEFTKPGELLIQLHPGETISSFQSGHARRSIANPLAHDLSQRQGIYKLQFDKQADLSKIKIELELDPKVMHVQYNHTLTKRGGPTPDDPLFSDQWYLERIGAQEIWNETTGGLTPCGDTIVIAVFDFGLDLSHEDMQDRIWANQGEIPNNDFDDDNNGYVDDYWGLNLDTGNDKHAIDDDFHGTAVASVIGAASNNGIGITGLNWHVKLMIISSVEKDEALAIEAFEYLIDQRKRYNESNGSEGAYIVAVNNSWGREGFFEEQFPLLCGMFDDLGEVGILSIGSTENDQVNTDVFGDIPSDCSSDFLVVVTNTGEDDQLAVGGFGRENVDLGAPGERIRVAARNNSYGYDSGTSFSAPIVAGSVGLLYSLPTATFCDNARLSPTDATLDLKRFLLAGVTPVTSLADRTVSGGRLNLALTADLVTSAPEQQIQVIHAFPNPSSGIFQFYLPEALSSISVVVYNKLGQLITIQKPLSAHDHHVINGNDWPNGYYILEIRNGEKVSMAKVMKY